MAIPKNLRLTLFASSRVLSLFLGCPFRELENAYINLALPSR